jgi:hypothetical protein
MNDEYHERGYISVSCYGVKLVLAYLFYRDLADTLLRELG